MKQKAPALSPGQEHTKTEAEKACDPQVEDIWSIALCYACINKTVDTSAHGLCCELKNYIYC